MANTNIGFATSGQIDGIPDLFATNDVTETTNNGTVLFMFVRILQGAGVTKKDVINALTLFERWIIEGGQTTGVDANLPIL